MYDLVRRALFTLSPETSHDFSLDGLSGLQRLGLLHLLPQPRVEARKTVFGIEFPNAVGLAAGLDKNADYLDALGQLGFGFIEVGTVTPKPQPGNPKPRLFRLPQSEAIINRMGFNNKGVDYLVERVRKAKYPGVIGINIGKNKVTPEEDALADYLYCLDRVYPHAHYVVVNLSSPNTPGLRNLQFGDALKGLLAGLKSRQETLSEEWGYRPILIKIAPDMTTDEIEQVAQLFNEYRVDGVVATNTTLSRERVEGQEHAEEAGGLSGRPLFEDSTRVLEAFRARLNDDIPLVGVGGITFGQDALTKIQAGADLVQLYTGFIYKGPRLVRDCVEKLAEL
ncbi:quinone-dependent dihydroorotate dehydrogenase [Saccharospirillum salsuginis]|uniref:Dihydroorotate dehydrogenase (quinone) n=1 Tax=Saccharospirillum salsuginis TaxID=418750 RepID=A0A918K689_9GAMM|nr:quinone-dependent dihydroorotate dehydrogenase [Saccharospirillum salsuginis]GGX51558.1 dihydroorotate dehydrogenase (quinone) [Saccharospirillum salsuginis]